MQKEPPPFIWACPEEKNILDCELTARVIISYPTTTSQADSAGHFIIVRILGVSLTLGGRRC